MQATVITKPQWKNSEGVKICENLWETIINPLKSIESNEESKKNRFDRGTLQCHTYINQDFPVEALEACHKARGFHSIGYHYYITKDGVVYPCRPESEEGAHARHYNAHSIGICYEGGLDEKGKPADTRTPAQKASLEDLLYSLVLDYPDAEILGHRDLPWVRKSCPCFDVKEWLKEIDFHL